MLTDMDCIPDPTSSDGIQPLHCAAGNGHSNSVRILLKAGVDVNGQAPGGCTPLFMAAECGYLDIVDMLITAKARVNVANDYGTTPLSTAVMHNKTGVAMLLIKSAAKVNKCDSQNNSPLHHAVRKGNLQVVKELLKSKNCGHNLLTKSFESPVHIAVRMGHTKILKTLIQYGCDVNLCDPVDRVTPLHVAVSVHHKFEIFSEIFHSLLEGKCRLNCRAFGTSETPLYKALELGKDNIAILLLSNGADPNLSSPFDITALQKACQKYKVAIAELLVNCGIFWRREKWMKNFGAMKGEITHNSAVNTLLRSWRFQPVSLQKLCRIRIRKNLGENLNMKLQCLQIPGKLQRYVLLHDLMENNNFVFSSGIMAS